MGKRLQLIRIASVSLLLAALTAGCGSAQKAVRLGFVSGLSGGNADTGEAGRNGAMIAVEEFNDKKKIKTELIIRDDGNDYGKAEKAAEDLISQHVDAIIGSFTTTTTEAILSVAGPENVLVVSPSASAYQLYGKDDMLIRLNSSTKDNAGDYADYLHSRMGLSSASVVMDTQNRSFSASWLEFFQKRLTELGGSVLTTQEFDSRGMPDYGKLIETLLKPAPDAIMLITNSVDTARIVQQLRKTDPRIPVLAAEWAGTEQLIELGGRSVDGLRMLQNVNLFDTGPEYELFKEKYFSRFGRNPSYSSVMAYEAVKVTMEAFMKKAPGESIKEAILKYGPYKGLTQTLDFNKYGDLKRESNFVVIHNRMFVPVKD